MLACMRALLALNLLLLVACGGRDNRDRDTRPADGGCDPAVRTSEVPLASPSTVTRLIIDPTTVDPAAVAYPESKHLLLLPAAPTRDQLFLILPGTNNLGQGFETIGMLAARAGYRVVSLAYESRTHPNGTCAAVVGEQAILACREGVWTEKAYGTEATAEYAGDFANSISGRLLNLLRYLQQTRPSFGAEAYLQGNTLRWERVALAGFSQGSVIAGFIGKDQPLARLVLLAGGCDDANRILVPWCSAPRATPRTRTWAISHVDDMTNADALVAAAFGLGAYVDISAGSPSYCSDSHALMSHESTDKPHLSVAQDGAVPLTNGVPTLAEDYVYAFTAP